MEDASAHSGIKFLAALNGICAGGGYELALACDEIILVDDSNSAVSLPETPLLGVLPGTGGLTRVVDKRKVRRDLADVFGTLAEGVKGKRAVEWRLVDAVYPTSQFKRARRRRARRSSRRSRIVRPTARASRSTPLSPKVEPDALALLRGLAGRSIARSAWRHLTVRGPDGAQPSSTPEEISAAGDQFWPLRAFRELDDALLRLRINEPQIGTIVAQARRAIRPRAGASTRSCSRTRTTGSCARSSTSSSARSSGWT